MSCSSCCPAEGCTELPVLSLAETWFMACWLVVAGCLFLLGQNQLSKRTKFALKSEV